MSVLGEVELQQVVPRQLAAAWGEARTTGPFGPLIIELLDLVWPVLRAQHARTGQNVVVYHGGPPLRLAAGVEVPDGFTPTETVRPVDTPSGEAVTAAHWGDYSQLGDAYTVWKVGVPTTRARQLASAGRSTAIGTKTPANSGLTCTSSLSPLRPRA